jgi:hypothetical protein
MVDVKCDALRGADEPLGEPTHVLTEGGGLLDDERPVDPREQRGDPAQLLDLETEPDPRFVAKSLHRGQATRQPAVEVFRGGPHEHRDGLPTRRLGERGEQPLLGLAGVGNLEGVRQQTDFADAVQPEGDDGSAR